MRGVVPALACLALSLVASAQGEVPSDVRGFCGQVTGVVTAKHEDGSFSLRVAQVTRVWKANTASDLEWFHGRTIRVGPRWVQGDDQQWRKVELHVQFVQQLAEQDDCRLEIRHAERDRFAILELSEAQRRLARGAAAEAGTLAAGARGFSGQVGGIVRGRNDDGTVQFEVVKVLQVWKGSRAERPEALVGKTVRLAPQWVQGDGGRWHPQEVHAAFLRKLAIGEDYRIELQNAEGDHFQLLQLSKAQREWARAPSQRQAK